MINMCKLRQIRGKYSKGSRINEGARDGGGGPMPIYI